MKLKLYSVERKIFLVDSSLQTMDSFPSCLELIHLGLLTGWTKFTPETFAQSHLKIYDM